MPPPDTVSIQEVGPRDGLQNEPVVVDTVKKLQLVNALVDAGLKRIEFSSFVSPRWVPQLADAEELARLIRPRPGVHYSALCPNFKGFQRAGSTGVKSIAVFLSASETHNRRNINRSIEGALEIFREMIPAARDYGMRVRGYVSTVWGCPFEGAIDPGRALALSQELLELGCFEISLGDTIGVGTPEQTRQILDLFLKSVPAHKLAMHMHDTHGLALDNVRVGLEMGIRTFDSAIAGLGGCPYAPGAPGNLATEDLVHMLERQGVHTGIDLKKLSEAGRVAELIVGRQLAAHRRALPSSLAS